MDDAQLLPSKRRATEEIISHRFSSMNISTANSSSYNQTNVPEEADMLSIVDVPIDDKSTPYVYYFIVWLMIKLMFFKLSLYEIIKILFYFKRFMCLGNLFSQHIPIVT